MNNENEVVEDDYASYLATLRRIPPEIRQSMATRDYDMGVPWTCVCGWAIREDMIRLTGIGEDAVFGNIQDTCVERFGGTRAEWNELFSGVCYPESLRAIETAFTIAVTETVR